MQNLPLAVDIVGVARLWTTLSSLALPFSLSSPSVSPHLPLLPPSPARPLLPLPVVWGHQQIVAYCLASQQRGGRTWSLLWRLLGIKEGKEEVVVGVTGVEFDTSTYTTIKLYRYFILVKTNFVLVLFGWEAGMKKVKGGWDVFTKTCWTALRC